MFPPRLKSKMPESPLVSPVELSANSSASIWESIRWSNRCSIALKSAIKLRDATAFAAAWREQVLPPTPGAARMPVGLCRWSWFPLDAADPIGRLIPAVFPTKDVKDRTPHRGAIKAGKHGENPLDQLVTQLVLKAGRWTSAEFITAGELLLTNSRQLSPQSFLGLWSRLAAESPFLATAPATETPDQFLVRAGEARLLAGWLLEPSQSAKQLAALGRKTMIAELNDQTDNDGTPHAELAARMPLWLAPLIRATIWAERLGQPLWTDEDRQRLALVLERAIPLCRPDGRLAMGNGLAFPAIPLLAAASKSLSLAGPAERLLRTLQNVTPGKPLAKRTTASVELMPSSQSDWARFAVLRSDWSSHADSLAISYHQPFPQLDVATWGQPILHGDWSWELQIDDAVIELANEWTCSCWHSDPDADYLELQMKGPGKLKVERQVLLSRKEQFMLLADVVRGAQSVARLPKGTESRIHFRSKLPLAAGVVAEPNQPTREVRFKAGKQSVRVFPLALADDRVQSTPHSCQIESHVLVLRQQGTANGLYAPLIFDWHPARTRKPALWRTLTVMEAGNRLSRDLAAGYRLQVGAFQLLIYRSLCEIKAARTVLGHHTWQESIIGRFETDGTVDPIMKVDE